MLFILSNPYNNPTKTKIYNEIKQNGGIGRAEP